MSPEELSPEELSPEECDAIKARMRKLLNIAKAQAGIESYKDVARAAGIRSDAAVRNLGPRTTSGTFYKLAKALGCSTHDLIPDRP